MSREPLAIMFFNPFGRGYFWPAFRLKVSVLPIHHIRIRTVLVLPLWLNIDHNGKLRQTEKCDGSHWGGRGSEYLGQGGKWLRGRSESQSADGFRVDCSILVQPPKYLSTLWAPFRAWFSDIPKHSRADSQYEMCGEQSQLLWVCVVDYEAWRWEVSFSTMLVLQQHGLCARDNRLNIYIGLDTDKAEKVGLPTISNPLSALSEMKSIDK